jgi:hypothetical protein
LVDSDAIIRYLWSVACRAVVCVLVALSIALNVASGAFAGIVHEHHHEHHHEHGHDHGDASDHRSADDDALTRTAVDEDPSPAGHHDKWHEHGGVTVLALVHSGASPAVDPGGSQLTGPYSGTRSDWKHQLERPPRRA